jgi:hypothetical protein
MVLATMMFFTQSLSTFTENGKSKIVNLYLNLNSIQKTELL